MLRSSQDILSSLTATALGRDPEPAPTAQAPADGAPRPRPARVPKSAVVNGHRVSTFPSGSSRRISMEFDAAAIKRLKVACQLTGLTQGDLLRLALDEFVTAHGDELLSGQGGWRDGRA